MVDQVEQVKARTDIVAIISERMPLKKAGRNYKGLCPFHQEKTPSFNVSAELQIYKCFGCGEGGDVIAFLEKYEGMDFYEVLTYLAKRVGITLTPLAGKFFSEKEKYYEMNNLAKMFYSYILLSHPSGKVGLNYLTQVRGLSLETIKTFGLGFSPENRSALRNFLINKKKFTNTDCSKVGLFYEKTGNLYDRFSGRVIFPLSDHRGNTLGFAGRILPGNDSLKLAKYINTPETEIYHKGNILYALDITKGHIKKEEHAVIMEGELDVISSWQAGIQNAVAIKGSALTDNQAKLLSRFTSRIVMALDADFAGDAAARRGVTIAEKEGFDIKVAKFGEYKDPDELARSDPKKLKFAIKDAVNVWDFIIGSIFRKHTHEGKYNEASISREIIPVLNSIEDSIVQAHYAEVVAKRLKVPFEAVVTQMQKVKADGPLKNTPVTNSQVEGNKKSRRELLEVNLFTALVTHNPQLLTDEKVYGMFSVAILKRIIDEVNLHISKSGFDISKFATVLPEELRSRFSDLVMGQVDEVTNREIESLKYQLGEEINKKDREDLAVKIRKLEAEGDQSKVVKMQEEYKELTRKKDHNLRIKK